MYRILKRILGIPPTLLLCHTSLFGDGEVWNLTNFFTQPFIVLSQCNTLFARRGGLEPPTHGLKASINCCKILVSRIVFTLLYQLSYLLIFVNCCLLVGRDGFEPPTHKFTCVNIAAKFLIYITRTVYALVALNQLSYLPIFANCH